MELKEAVELIRELVEIDGFIAHKQAFRVIEGNLQTPTNRPSAPCPKCGSAMAPLMFCTNNRCVNHYVD